VTSDGTAKPGRGILREFLAAILFFLTGVAFLLLTALGPVYFGAAFDGGYLNWIGAGLIIVAVYVTVGVNLPRLLAGRERVGRADDDEKGAV
jgi:hypothetical protein